MNGEWMTFLTSKNCNFLNLKFFKLFNKNQAFFSQKKIIDPIFSGIKVIDQNM